MSEVCWCCRVKESLCFLLCYRPGAAGVICMSRGCGDWKQRGGEHDSQTAKETKLMTSLGDLDPAVPEVLDPQL